MKKISIVVLLLSLCGPLHAQPSKVWLPSECDPSSGAEYARAAERQRAATPTDPAYLPHPYPSADKEVIEDFIYRHRRAYSDVPVLPIEERRFFDAFEAGDLRYEIFKVANWTPARCGRHRMADFYFLIRFFKRNTGEEVTRAALDNSGHVAAVVHGDPGVPIQDFRSLQQARQLLGDVLKEPIGMTQYVTTWGTLRCEFLWPCVAMQGERSIILAHEDEVWRVEADRPTESVRARMGTLAARRDFLQRLRDGTDKMVTLGGDSLSHITRVED